MAPLRTSVPVSVLARVPPLTTPLRVSALPLVSTVPVPVMATVLATVRLASDSSVVPVAIVSAPVPSAELVTTLMVPPVRLVPPAYVLAPVSDSVPVSVLVRVPLPLTTPPRVSVLALVSTVLVPVMPTALASVRFAALDSSVVPVAIASAPVPSAALLPTWMVPPLRVVPPV